MSILSLSTVAGQSPLLSSHQTLAGLGKVFVVTEPTLGTGIAYALKTSTSATANGFLCVSNGAQSGGPNIYFDRLAIVETATAPTGTLNMVFEAIGETGIVAMSGAVAATTPVQLNTALPQTTNATVQLFAAGAATVPAAKGTRRTVGHADIPTGVCVAGDLYTVDFGIDGQFASRAGLTAARATDTSWAGGSMGPIVVAPQNTVWLNMYWVTAAANTPSFTVNFSYIEV